MATRVDKPPRVRSPRVHIEPSALRRYQPGTVVIITGDDFHFVPAAIDPSDNLDDVFLSERRYNDQSKAHDAAERWFETRGWPWDAGVQP